LLFSMRKAQVACFVGFVPTKRLLEALRCPTMLKTAGLATGIARM
jgi:hypothetical protein